MRSLEELLARPTPNIVPDGGGVVRAITRGGDRAGRAALASECQRVAATPPGGRDHALNVAAYRMGQLIAAGHLDVDVVVEELRAAGVASGQTELEVLRALRRDETGGLAAGMANPRRLDGGQDAPAASELTAWTPPTVAGGAGEEGEDVDAAVRAAFPLVDWHAAWEEDPGEEWIIEPILPARRLIALFSPPKTGKSLLCLEIAAGIASGRGALGVRMRRTWRVLYVDFENDVRGDVVPRLRAMGYNPRDLADLAYLSFPNLAALDTPRGGAELMAAVQAYTADVVIIDTVSRTVAGEENSNDTWTSWYRNTGSALKAAGVAVLRLDHSGKDVEKGMRGGSAKSSDVDAVWAMSAVDEHTLKLACTDNRFPIVEKELILRREQGPLRHRVDPDGSFGLYRDALAAAVLALDRLEAPVTVTVRDAQELLRDAGHGVRASVVTAAVKVRKTRAEEDV